MTEILKYEKGEISYERITQFKRKMIGVSIEVIEGVYWRSSLILESIQ